MKGVDEALRSSSIFRRLGSEDCSRVAAVARLRDYARGDVIFREGDPSDAFYTVIAGRVKVFKMLPTGKDVILEIFSGGDPLGAIAAYEGRPFPASAAALEDTRCLILPRTDFFALLERHPALVRGLLYGMTQRLVELTIRVTQLSGGRVEARLARLFL
jgi:CRP/FNR family transcriptional regulator